jgi:ABC-2 type transport system permease protein
MTTGNRVFRLRQGAGWTRGLGNLLQAEWTVWFGTRRWLRQVIIWAVLVNLPVLAAVRQGMRGGADMLVVFMILLGMAAPFGVCALMQGAIVDEKQSGTAAWVLSKPVGRSAFVVAKLLGNLLGIAVTVVLAQGTIAYVIMYAASGKFWPLPPFAAALGVQMAHLLFYMTLSLALGALCSQRGPVIGVPLALLFAQYVARDMVPGLAKAFPIMLTLPLGQDETGSAAMAVAMGQTQANWLPLLTTLVGSLLFFVVALWAFDRQEV